MPLGPADSYPLVLWHDPVVDGPLEESMLVGEKNVILKKLKRMRCNNRRTGTNVENGVRDSEEEKVEDPH